MTTSSNRILALDILRGITVAGMLLVNDPGSWKYVYTPLDHAEWIGLTPTDLIFPFFMFIMGISTYISLRKYNFEWHPKTALKVIRRALVIYLIGVGLAYISLSMRTWHSTAGQGLGFGAHLWASMTNFHNLRLLGVFPRLGICYGLAALIVLSVRHKLLPWLISVLLVGYMFVLWLGNGFAYNETNILSVVDRAVLGLNHMYKDNGIDPEGLLSTIPAVAHVLIGFCMGKVLLDTKGMDQKMLRLLRIGCTMLFGGFLLKYACPISKKVWSPSFVLVTCGAASSLLALLIWLVDVKGCKKPFRFFQAFGINPLFTYTWGTLLAILIIYIRVPLADGGYTSVQGIIYDKVFQPLLGNYPGSLGFAIAFVCFVWLFGYVLYKKHIYIKI
jgi:predicted acyltransferase